MRVTRTNTAHSSNPRCQVSFTEILDSFSSCELFFDISCKTVMFRTSTLTHFNWRACGSLGKTVWRELRVIFSLMVMFHSIKLPASGLSVFQTLIQLMMLIGIIFHSNRKCAKHKSANFTANIREAFQIGKADKRHNHDSNLPKQRHRSF